jgi:hypothetical protein
MGVLSDLRTRHREFVKVTSEGGRVGERETISSFFYNILLRRKSIIFVIPLISHGEASSLLVTCQSLYSSLILSGFGLRRMGNRLK